jgi:autotransporter translocation and assembly factor TamB
VIAGEFTAKNLQVQGSEWTSATSKFRASASEIVLQNASLVNAHQGKATLSANVGLQNWSYQPSSPITLNLSVQRMAIADLQRLANSKYPVSGDLSAEVSVHGSQLSPSGSGNAKIDNARAYGEPIQHLAATFHADKSSMSSTLDVNLLAGAANVTVSYTPKTKAYNVRLNAPSIILQKLQTVQEKNLAIAGTLTLSASGQGTLDNPQLVVTIAVPQLQLRDKSISQIKGAINVANQRAEVTFDSEVAQASVHSRGTVNLTGDYETEATIDTNGVPLDPLLAMFTTSLPQGFQGETELHGTLKGPLKDKSRIEAHLTIPTLKARYQSLEIGAASPIRVDYSHSVITLQPG